MNCFAYEKYSLKSTLILRKYIVFVIILIFVNSATAQIVTGSLRQRTFGGTTFLYYIPTSASRATLHYYFILYAVDSTGKDSSYCVSGGLGKKIKNGWNGYQPITNGDSIVFTSILLITDPTSKTNIENCIQFAQDSLPDICMDTSRHLQNILTAYGNSANYFQIYLLNTGFLGSEKFDKCFRKNGFADIASTTVNVTQWANLTSMGSWFFYGTSGGFPYSTGYTTDSYDSALVHNPAPNTKITAIAGQNYSPVTHDSIYSNLGIDATNNIFRFWYNAYEGIDTSLPKLRTDSFNLFDYTGCWRYGRGTYYFDSKANPLHGDFTNDSTTGNTLIGGEDCYITSYRRNRIFGVHFDSLTILKYAYICTSPNCSGSDTVQVYTKNDSCESRTFISNMTLSTTPTFTIISTGGQYGWQRVYVGNDTTQDIIIQLRKNNNCETNITGFVFYGKNIAGGSTIYNYDTTVWATADTNRATLRDLTGVTAYNLYQQHDLDSLTNIRNGLEQIFMFDTTKLVEQPAQNLSSRDYYDSTLNTFMPGRIIYINMQGPNTKVFHDAGDDFNQRPVNNLGDDRRVPQNFSDYSKNAYSMAALYGNNPSVNMANASIKNWDGSKAKNIYKGLEPTNEALEAVVGINYTMDPICEANMVGMIIDNWGSTYGPYGAKNADPNFKIILPATVGWDIQGQRSVLRLLQFGYHTTRPPIDLIAFHTYAPAIKSDISLNANALIGDYSTTPSNLGYYQDYKNYIHLIFGMWHGYIPIVSNEYGADKQYARTKTVNGQFDTSLYGCPHYTGYTQPQSLGIMTVSQLLEFSTLPMAQANVFTFKDDLGPAQNFIYPAYSGAGMLFYFLHPITFALDSTRYWDNYYYYKGITQSLFSYHKEKVLDSIAGGLWRIKYRSTTNPFLVCYVVFNDDTAAASVPFTLNVGAVTGTLVKTGNFNTISLNSSGQSVVNGVISGNATAKHQLFFTTELLFRGFTLSQSIFFGH